MKRWGLALAAILAAWASPGHARALVREVGQVGPDSSALLLRASDSGYVEITRVEGLDAAQIRISPDSLDRWRDSVEVIASVPAAASPRDEIHYDGPQGNSIFDGV